MTTSNRSARRLSLLLIPVALALVLPLGVQAQDPPDPQDAVSRSVIPDDLRQTYTAYKQALNRSADDAIQYYASDAVVMVDSKHIFRGLKEIKIGFLEHFLEAQSSTSNANGEAVTPLEQVVADSVVTLVGRHGTQAEGERRYGGVYSNTWTRQPDGRWTLVASVITVEPSAAQK